MLYAFQECLRLSESNTCTAWDVGNQDATGCYITTVTLVTVATASVNSYANSTRLEIAHIAQTASGVSLTRAL